MTRIEIPTNSQISETQVAGAEIDYSGAGIYVRYQTILKVLAGFPADRILVIGCGHGIFDRLLPSSSELVGVDIGENEIQTATAWASQHRPQSRYFLGEVESLPLANAWADLTIASEVIEHLPEANVPRFLETARRLTKPDGKVVVTVPNIRQLRNRARRMIGRDPVFMDPAHDREYTLETAFSTIKSAGLAIDSVHGAVLYGPFEKVGQTLIPAGSALRTSIAARWPKIASHLIFICSP